METTDVIKLLAIDDNSDNLTTLSAVVMDTLPQTIVLTATNGPAGIDLAAAEDPDVILLDIVMPGIDSFEVCRRLKADEQLKEIPAVFVTDHKTDAANRVKALEVGAEGFLTKPLEPAELIAQLRAMVKVKTANRSQRLEKEQLEALVAERTRALRESEQKFRLLHESAGLGIGYYTPDGVVISYNEIAARQMNGRPEDFKDRSLHEIFSKETALVYMDRMNKAIHADASQVYEDLVELPTKIALFLSTYTRILDSSGMVIGVQIISNEITERKRAEAAMQESQARLKEAQAIGKIGNWSFDPVSETFAFSDEMYVLLERDPLLGPPTMSEALAYFHPADVEDTKAHFRNALESGLSWDHDGQVLLPSRKLTWHHGTGVPCKNADGKVVSIKGTTQDITARKQAEESLRKSESLFKKVFEILPIGLWIADKSGKLMQGNPAGVKIWGMEPKVGQREYGVFKARRLPSGEEIPPEEWALAHTVNKGVTIVDELLEIDAFDGKKKIILNYTAPILDSNGEVEGAIVVNQDITARKRAEESLQQASDILNNMQMGLYVYELENPEDDRTLRMVATNPASQKLTSVAAEELLGKRIDEIFSALRALDIPKRFADVVRTGKASEFEDFYYADDRVLEAAYAVKAFPLPNHRVGITFDNITERKQAEDDLKRRNDELTRFNRAAVGRELRMIELKQKINELSRRLGEPPPHALAFLQQDSTENLPVATDQSSTSNHQENKT